MSREAMKLALEALEEAWYHVGTFQPTEKAIDLYDEARTALREALAEQPAQHDPSAGTQVSKVCWDGEKLMEKPIPLEDFYKPAQQGPVAWKNAAIRLGEELSSVGPDGYYDMTAEQWLDWAMDQRPHGKNSLPAQRTWVGLTDEERKDIELGIEVFGTSVEDVLKEAEAKLREKNNGN